jgi:predicted TPR repeat methyltransferase
MLQDRAPNPFTKGSGDLLADRRYSYAEMATGEGDWNAAVDLYRQTLEKVPHWPPALFGLARALAEAGEPLEAQLHFRACAALDPEDRLGAKAWLARLGAADGGLSTGYVTALFDEYAPRFEAHLTGALAYCVPEAIAAAISDLAPGWVAARALDLGCGTGLMAKALQGRVGQISGCDLAPGMIREAERTGLYAELGTAEATEWLMAEPKESADLILAADVFCYVERLEPLLLAARRAIRAGGLMAFSVQTHPGSGVMVGADLRVHHAVSHVEGLAAAARWRAASRRDLTLRLDRAVPVAGAIFVLQPAE